MNKHIKYETFWRRFAALIIDGIILSLINKIFDLIPASNSVFISIFISIIDTSSPYIYAILMVGKYGQTIGKMLMDVMVVDNDSEVKATYYQAFMREAVPLFVSTAAIIVSVIILEGVDIKNFKFSALGYIILFLPSGTLFIWSVLEILTMLFNEKSRALHDILADTVVIKIKNKQ